jgi:DNA-binding XRE family transcriptional regulator
MPQSMILNGKRYILLEQAEYNQLLARTQELPEPAFPEPDARGYYPALETAAVVIARKISRGRRALGLTQVELARQAGIRPETLNRIEQAKHTPTVATIDKIDRALKAAGEVDEPDVGLLPHERWLQDHPQASPDGNLPAGSVPAKGQRTPRRKKK